MRNPDQPRRDVSLAGRLVRYWRTKRGLSRASLASLIGVSRPAVVQWETGKTAPREERLDDIASVLNLTLEEFYRGERDMEAELAGASG